MEKLVSGEWSVSQFLESCDYYPDCIHSSRSEILAVLRKCSLSPLYVAREFARLMDGYLSVFVIWETLCDYLLVTHKQVDFHPTMAFLESQHGYTLHPEKLWKSCSRTKSLEFAQWALEVNPNQGLFYKSTKHGSRDTIRELVTIGAGEHILWAIATFGEEFPFLCRVILHEILGWHRVFDAQEWLQLLQFFTIGKDSSAGWFWYEGIQVEHYRAFSASYPNMLPDTHLAYHCDVETLEYMLKEGIVKGDLYLIQLLMKKDAPMHQVQEVIARQDTVKATTIAVAVALENVLDTHVLETHEYLAHHFAAVYAHLMTERSWKKLFKNHIIRCNLLEHFESYINSREAWLDIFVEARECKSAPSIILFLERNPDVKIEIVTEYYEYDETMPHLKERFVFQHPEIAGHLVKNGVIKKDNFGELVHSCICWENSMTFEAFCRAVGAAAAQYGKFDVDFVFKRDMKDLVIHCLERCKTGILMVLESTYPDDLLHLPSLFEKIDYPRMCGEEYLIGEEEELDEDLDDISVFPNPCTLAYWIRAGRLTSEQATTVVINNLYCESDGDTKPLGKELLRELAPEDVKKINFHLVHLIKEKSEIIAECLSYVGDEILRAIILRHYLPREKHVSRAIFEEVNARQMFPGKIIVRGDLVFSFNNGPLPHFKSLKLKDNTIGIESVRYRSLLADDIINGNKATEMAIQIIKEHMTHSKKSARSADY